jgi:hypothetical protein
MQRFYSAVLLAALLLSFGSYMAIPVLLLVPNPPRGAIVAIVVMLVVMPFVVICLRLRRMSGGALCVACPRPVYISIAVAATVVAVSWLTVGFLRWPAAPVRPVNGVFVDKRGTVYSNASYEAFRRWEVTLPPAWLPFALVAITALPASGRARWVRTC